jgi:hypothetical protein
VDDRLAPGERPRDAFGVDHVADHVGRLIHDPEW